jgi:uncharacterized membrane protein
MEEVTRDDAASDEVEDAEFEATHRNDALDKTFNITLWLKGLDGVFELVGGILLLIIKPDTIDDFARNVTLNELDLNPHDFIARHILHFTGNLNHTQFFGAMYLLVHGLAKLIVVVGLYRREHWSYYVAFVFLGGFGIYQIYRLAFVHFSILLLLLTLFDAFILVLTVAEFRRMRAARAVALAET